MGKLTGTSLVGGTVNYERVENDYYATDPESTRALLREVVFAPGVILEPCCGEGHISKELEKALPNNAVSSFDLIDRGYGEGGVDFLKTKFEDKKYSSVISNPPYKLAKEFIEKSLKLTTDKVAMFLKIQFLEGQARKEWLKKSPLKYVYIRKG